MGAGYGSAQSGRAANAKRGSLLLAAGLYGAWICRFPQAGPAAGPESIRAVAQRAEAIGYDSLWVFDRLLSPVAPKSLYPAGTDGKLPEITRRVLDPIGTLTFAAAVTKRARLGSSILNLPYYNPVALARQLTTLDVLS